MKTVKALLRLSLNFHDPCSIARPITRIAIDPRIPIIPVLLHLVGMIGHGIHHDLVAGQDVPAQVL